MQSSGASVVPVVELFALPSPSVLGEVCAEPSGAKPKAVWLEEGMPGPEADPPSGLAIPCVGTKMLQTLAGVRLCMHSRLLAVGKVMTPGRQQHLVQSHRCFRLWLTGDLTRTAGCLL